MISEISNFSFNVALISDDYFESFLPASSDVTGVLKTTRSNRLKLRLYNGHAVVLFRSEENNQTFILQVDLSS